MTKYSVKTKTSLSIISLMVIMSANASNGKENTHQTLSPQKQNELIYLLKQDCGSCHGMTLKGGLGPALLPENITLKGREYLTYVIAKGIDQTPMPPWENILAPEEIDFLVDYLLTPKQTEVQ